MKTAVLLLFQTVLAGALFVVEPSVFGIFQDNPQGWLKGYQETAELFSIPFCLLLFSYSRSWMFLILRLGWGLWTSLISTALLWQGSVHFPEITDLGYVLAAFNTVCGFSLALTALREISKKLPNEPSTQALRDAAPPKVADQEIDLVEGV